MTTTTAMPVPQRLLRGQPDAAADALTQAMVERGVVAAVGGPFAAMSTTGKRAVSDEVARLAAGLADLDLVTILVAVWRKHALLRRAAERTLESPGSHEVVELTNHRVTSVHRPTVDLLVDSLLVGSIHLEVRIEIGVFGLIATLRAGRLVRVHSGRAEVGGSIACEGVELSRVRRELDLPGVLELGQGIPLVEEPAARDPDPARPAGQPHEVADR